MGSIQNQKLPYFFRIKPLFGLDIGNGSLKVMQTTSSGENAKKNSSAKHVAKLVGYGSIKFNPEAINNGVVVNPSIIAEAAQKLFNEHLIGDVTTRRVALTIPSYRTFTRSITLPPDLKGKAVREAVHLEIEQYLPMPIGSLYLDYQLIRQTVQGQEFLVVAVPKEIVDSYLELSEVMGLEAVCLETTMSAAGRLFTKDYQSDVPTVIIDFGSLSSDISVFDGTIVTTSTVQGGGDVFTKSIQEKLGVTHEEAHVIKVKYGLGVSKRQKEVIAALTPVFQQITKEIKRLIRFYEEHYGTEHPIKQIVTLGGGSNIPGLNEYLTENLRLAVRPCDPWQYLSEHKLKLPSAQDKQMFATAAGLSMTDPGGVFSND